MLPRRQILTSCQFHPTQSRIHAVVAVAGAIDWLTSPQTSLGEKQALWDQLREAGELDDTIAGLKQLAADNPGDAAIPTALGEAKIAKIRSVLEIGGDQNEVGILGMQADQDFSQALKIDPGNWEAQFDKASSLAHWPPELNKGPEVIQRLSSLVTQQETMPLKPEFAQTYILLGQQYQVAGQSDKAVQAWQQGIAKFPADTTLQKIWPMPPLNKTTSWARLFFCLPRCARQTASTRRPKESTFVQSTVTGQPFVADFFVYGEFAQEAGILFLGGGERRKSRTRIAKDFGREWIPHPVPGLL